MKRYGIIFVSVAAAIGVAGCSGSVAKKAEVAPPARPLKIAGVAFLGRSREAITSALDSLGLYPARTNSQYWCDFWAQGSNAKTVAKFPGLDHARVCYTRHGRWADTVLVYGDDMASPLTTLHGAKRPSGGWDLARDNDPAGTPTFRGLVQAIASEYGKPSDDMAPPVGPQLASWITSAGNIIVEKTWPAQTITLTLTDPPVYRAWKAQMKAQQTRQQQAANPLGS